MRASEACAGRPRRPLLCGGDQETPDQQQACMQGDAAPGSDTPCCPAIIRRRLAPAEGAQQQRIPDNEPASRRGETGVARPQAQQVAAGGRVTGASGGVRRQACPLHHPPLSHSPAGQLLAPAPRRPSACPPPRLAFHPRPLPWHRRRAPPCCTAGCPANSRRAVPSCSPSSSPFTCPSTSCNSLTAFSR